MVGHRAASLLLALPIDDRWAEFSFSVFCLRHQPAPFRRRKLRKGVAAPVVDLHIHASYMCNRPPREGGRRRHLRLPTSNYARAIVIQREPIPVFVADLCFGRKAIPFRCGALGLARHPTYLFEHGLLSQAALSFETSCSAMVLRSLYQAASQHHSVLKNRGIREGFRAGGLNQLRARVSAEALGLKSAFRDATSSIRAHCSQ